MSGFNAVDYFILLIFLVSILAGLSRGVIKEVLSLMTWVAAFVVAGLFSSRLAAYFTNLPELQSAMSSTSNSLGINTSQPIGWLAFGLSFAGLFSVTMIMGSLISSLIGGAASGLGIGLINRFLGGIFGLARGFLVCLLLIFLCQLAPQVQRQPIWTQSYFVNAFQPSVQWFGNLVAPGVATLKSTLGQGWQDINNRVGGIVNSFGR